MWTRNLLILTAAGALSATPVLAQQKTQPPSKPATSVSQDTTKAKTRKHPRTTTAKSTAATTRAVPATPATPASPSMKTDTAKTEKKVASAEHKTRRHKNKNTTKKPTSESKKG